jgi:hypothetical protein
MKNVKIAFFSLTILLGFMANVSATEFQLPALKIQFIRAVGEYENPIFSNTIELWFTTPLQFPSGSSCTDTRRVYISSKNYHLVAAAYMAFSKGKTVNVALDESLPNRGGACEVTYLDILPQ